MTGINFERWSPIPNAEIDNLCLNKSIPVKVRVQWAIIRIIMGFDENRQDTKADIGLRFLVTKTGASKRQTIRTIKRLEADGQVEVQHTEGGKYRNTYHIEFDGALEMHTFFDRQGKPYHKSLPKNNRLDPEDAPF